ncbi:MAG: hypothetical protein QXL54_00975 [Candidatus Bathyarchaeia archaeon]
MVNKEFEEQSYFARMWAKRIFQQRSGLSIKDWIRNAIDLAIQFQNLSQALKAGRKEEGIQIKAKLPFLIDSLEKLADYFQSTREDAKSFIKDPTVLSAAIEALTYREKTVRALISTLERIEE